MRIAVVVFPEPLTAVFSEDLIPGYAGADAGERAHAVHIPFRGNLVSSLRSERPLGVLDSLRFAKGSHFTYYTGDAGWESPCV